MARLNLRIILLHGLLVVLAAYAFVALGYIYDTPMAELYLESGDLGRFEEEALVYEVNAARISNFKLVHQAAPYAGALFAVALSFIANRRRKYSPLNTLVVLGIALVLALTGFLNQQFLRTILFAPGRLISGSVATAYTLNYLLLLGLSFWLAFSARVIPPANQQPKV